MDGMPNILIDKNIPYALELFNKVGRTKIFDNKTLHKKLSKNTDILVVRSVTKVNERLIKNTGIRFVGSVTSGTDHVDKEWMKNNGVFFCHADGCNAISVVEYVISALLSQIDHRNFQLKEKVFGIVGYGNIGSLLRFYLNNLGITTILYDPIMSPTERKKGEIFVTMEELVHRSDIISIHSSLDSSSYHLFNEDILDAIGTNRILINTSRGSLIDNQALALLFHKGKKIKIILDVWENEPHISEYLFDRVMLGTPHIAGYSIESKMRGVFQIFEKLNKFLKKEPMSFMKDRFLPIPKFKEIYLNGSVNQEDLRSLIHLIYNANDDSFLWKKMHERDRKNSFENFRNNYPIRREWSSIEVNCNDVSSFSLLKKIGFIAKSL
ncbi:4-phosphoerythronate dehydrogenase [Candidatus Riesia pediculischaeffi]|uniref:Erythronate-4-phosphate dehydrogenase n=1 Tax=Candidatus Riesia pediculischaeffi TaxID=428411 RepID=A0A1V0HKC0_9ENTR|nr:4-phosphoerythronate dehydrogenase [Candidatus Riesia pediculischaeffi]ARC53171.1 hypothetical protein AOQ87_00430 [Candidatus Riesia pediculischaeffi]